MSSFTSLYLTIAFFSLVLATTSTADVLAEDIVTCDGGFFRTLCPASHPICCYRAVTDIYAACCPLNTVCDLDQGVCLMYNSTNRSSSSNNGKNNVTRRDVVWGEATDGVNMPISSGAAMFAGLTVGMIVGVAACIVLGMYATMRFDLRLARRRQQALRDAHRAEAESSLGSSSSSGSASNSSSSSSSSSIGSLEAALEAAGANDGELPSEALCVICCDAKKDGLVLPCSHLSSCYPCAVQLQTDTGICCLCRTPIRQVVKIRRNRKPIDLSKLDANVNQ